MKGFKDSVHVSTPENHKHVLSAPVYTTFDLYQFRPVFCEEMYPSDKFSVGVSDYFRANSMAGAVYGNFHKKYAAFFVPYRILWDKWNDFITGGSNGRLEPSFPTIPISQLFHKAAATYGAVISHEDDENEDLWLKFSANYRNLIDFYSDLGLPVKDLWAKTNDNTSPDYLYDHYRSDITDFEFPILRFAAMQRIWFDWFRDQNLIGDDLEDTYCSKNIGGSHTFYDVDDPLSTFYNGPEEAFDMFFEPKPVPLEKDYFTTAMVEPQRGGAAFVPVSLPSLSVNPGMVPPSSGTFNLRLNPNGTVTTSGGSEGVANDIIGMFDYNLTRVAKGIQRYLELNNVAGGADLQQLLAHWGTAPNPAVFQKSTFIGAFSDKLQLSEVVSPSDTGYGSKAGEVVTRLQAVGNGKFEYTANEHGFFVIVMVVRPELAYSEGIRRELLHGALGNGRFDFYTPELEKTGFQPQYIFEYTDAILLKKNESEYPDVKTPRGYVPRYAEGKRTYPRITGQMATRLYDNLRISKDYGIYAELPFGGADISTSNTMVFGYPADFRFDCIFSVEHPLYDHFDGWIYFDFEKESPMNEYSAPLVENSNGNDISLPYAGVRL